MERDNMTNGLYLAKGEYGTSIDTGESILVLKKDAKIKNITDAVIELEDIPGVFFTRNLLTRGKNEHKSN